LVQGGWRAAGIRWAKQGVWERSLKLVLPRGTAPGLAVLDSTTLRAHQKASGVEKGSVSQKRDYREALGRPRSGWGTKAA
jgi:hypothetical protein